MKIVYVSDAIYPYNKGGKEKRLYELSTRLATLGHDVHIYTMHWWQTAEIARVEDGVTLHAISKYYPLYKAGGDRRSIKEALLFSLACFRLISVHFDVLDVDHMPFFPVYTAWVVCTLRGQRRKFYGTWHEALSRKDWMDYMGLMGTVAAGIERLSIHMPYAVTAASAHTQSLIRSELHRSRRVLRVTSGIDIQQIAAVRPLRTKCDVLYTGRLVKDKNVDILIEAVALLAADKPTIRCIIIGHGIEKPQLQALITECGLSKHISLLDPVAEASDVYRYMKSAKVFCLPSIREGFGIVALESIACGTPVVTTSAPANAAKDLIQSGVDGTVVGVEPVAFAEALDYWISHRRPAGIAENVVEYDWDKLAAQQEAVYSA